MAGRKKGEAAALQAEVNTDEDWQKLLELEGLVVVDIYSDWCGPCSAMASFLKKLKLEIGGEHLHFAIAKADNIRALKRFRNKSEPTWMFIGTGFMVKLVFGADAPKLVKMISTEHEKEKNVLEGNAERQILPFDELTQEEIERKKRKRAEMKALEMQDEETVAQALNELRMKSSERLGEDMHLYSIIVVMPYLISDPNKKLLADVMRKAGIEVIRDVVCEVRPNRTYDIFVGEGIESLEEVPEELQEILDNKPCYALLIKTEEEVIEEVEAPPEEEKAPEEVAEEEGETVEEDKILAKLKGADKKLYTIIGPYMWVDVENHPECLKARFGRGEYVPGVWSPHSIAMKARTIQWFFPDFAKTFLPVIQKTKKAVAIFHAQHKEDVLAMIEEQQMSSEIIVLGIKETSTDDAKVLALSEEDYQHVKGAFQKGEKFILAIKKTGSDLIRVLKKLDPLYISPNSKAAEEDFFHFFPHILVDDDE